MASICLLATDSAVLLSQVALSVRLPIIALPVSMDSLRDQDLNVCLTSPLGKPPVNAHHCAFASVLDKDFIFKL